MITLAPIGVPHALSEWIAGQIEMDLGERAQILGSGPCRQGGLDVSYPSSWRRTLALRPWLRHYNVERPHAALGYQPTVRPLSEGRPVINLVRSHS